MWKIKKGWGLLAVVAAMVVALAGGTMSVYAIQQSTISSSFTVSPPVIHSGATMAYENWGSNATRSSAATPASSNGVRARIYLGDEVGEVGINFKVEGKDFHLENAYSDLKVQINFYMEGENTEVWKGENVILLPVKEGIARNVENRADNYGARLATGLVYDRVIHIFDNTENVNSVITGDIQIHLEVVVYTAPRVETRGATAVGISVATLHGELLDLGEHDSADVWFKWRREGGVWGDTSKQTLSAPGGFSTTLSGLLSGTTYEFKAVAENPTGGSLGAVLSFATATPPPPPSPAKFELDNLNIAPLTVVPDELVEISARVLNVGGSRGTYTVMLTIEGVTVDSKDVTLDAGVSTSVSFKVSRTIVGTYTVSVDGLSGTFEVLLPAPPPENIERMPPEEAAEILAAAEPENAARTLEKVSAEKVGEIFDAGVEIGLTDNIAEIVRRMDPSCAASAGLKAKPSPFARVMESILRISPENAAKIAEEGIKLDLAGEASIVDEMETGLAASLLIGIYELPGPPELAGKLLEAMSLDRSTAVVQTLIEDEMFEYVDGMFLYLTDEVLNDIYGELTTGQRGELYPHLSPEVVNRISMDLLPRFEVSNLAISRTEVEPGESTTILVDVTNTGGTPGTYLIELLIEGEVVERKDVTVFPDETKSISFTVSRKEIGTYHVTVDGQFGSFEVKKPKPFPWAFVGGIIAAIIVIIILGVWFWRRRK